MQTTDELVHRAAFVLAILCTGWLVFTNVLILLRVYRTRVAQHGEARA